MKKTKATGMSLAKKIFSAFFLIDLVLVAVLGIAIYISNAQASFADQVHRFMTAEDHLGSNALLSQEAHRLADAAKDSIQLAKTTTIMLLVVSMAGLILVQVILYLVVSSLIKRINLVIRCLSDCVTRLDKVDTELSEGNTPRIADQETVTEIRAVSGKVLEQAQELILLIEPSFPKEIRRDKNEIIPDDIIPL